MKTNITLLLFVFYAIGAFSQISHPADGLIYDRTQVAKIEIFIDADSLAQMLDPANLFLDHEYPADMIYTRVGQVDTVSNIGFRLRGNTSRNAAKKSFKVSVNTFTSGRRYNGVKDMNLNGEHNDPSISRSRIAWQLGSEFGLPVSRTAHCELHINGVYMGVYINIEHINDDWLGLRFGNSSGNLYKCTWPADLNFISNNPNDYKLTKADGTRVYELKTNENIDNYAGLANFINILNNTPTNQLACALDAVFNIEGYLHTLAYEVATGHWDNYSFNKNNYYLYENPASGKIEYIPYDIDNSFGVDWFNIDWATRNINNWGNNSNNLPLSERLLALPQYNEIYKFYLAEIIQQLSSTSHLNHIDAVRVQIETHAFADTFKSLDYGFSNIDFINSFDSTQAQLHVKKGIKTYIQQRSASAITQLGTFNVAPIVRYTNVVFTTTPNQVLVTAQVEDESAVNVVCTYSSNGGNNQTVILYDDGLHGDGAANDGTFSNFINSLPTGTFAYQITATDATNKSRTQPCTPKSMNISAPGSLVINEFMADNDNTIADNTNTYSDWIELYNNSNDSIFLGDYYLTDKTNNPFLWQLPSEYIHAGGFKLIWASNNVSAGQNHTNFALSKGGEQIGLFKNNGGAADTADYIIFGAQTTDVSYGRMYDASPVWVFFPTSTPNATNGTIGIDEDGLMALAAYPNPFQQEWILQNKSNEILHVEVFNAMGQLLYQQKIEALETIRLEDNFAAGLRLVKLTNGQTERVFKMIAQ